MLDISIEEVVNLILDKKLSIRETAKIYNCSKDAIFTRLKKYHGSRKQELTELLESNIKNSRFKEKK